MIDLGACCLEFRVSGLELRDTFPSHDRHS